MASAMTSSGSRSPALRKTSVRALSANGTPACSAALTAASTARTDLVERLDLVLEVRADDADVDRAGDRAARVAVAALEVGAHGELGLTGDEADLGDHLVAGDHLAVGVAAGGGDAVARRRERRRAGDVGDGAGGDRVPHVHHEEQLRGGVQPLELLGLVEGAHTSSNFDGAQPIPGDRGSQPPVWRVPQAVSSGRRSGAAQTGGPSGAIVGPPVVWWTPRGDCSRSGAPDRVRNHGFVCLGCHPCAPNGGRPRPGI